MSFLIKIPQSLIAAQTAKLKPGEEVDWSDKHLTDKSEEEIIINVAAELKIPAKDIFKHLKVTLTEKISENAVIAEKKTMFASQTLRFPTQGEIRSINHHEGTVTIVKEKLSKTPFIFQGVYEKTEGGWSYFKVKGGVALELLSSFPKTIAGPCYYIDKETEIDPEKITGKVVVTSFNDRITLSKIAAFDDLAIIVYKTNYYHRDSLILPVQDHDKFKELFSERWPRCLYLENSKIIYFYKN